MDSPLPVLSLQAAEEFVIESLVFLFACLGCVDITQCTDKHYLIVANTAPRRQPPSAQSYLLPSRQQLAQVCH